MKLRNKKTGEIKEYTHTMTSYHIPIEGGHEIFTPWKPEEWEELEDTKEPLIKDEKIRKAVRAWAEANDFIDEIKVEGLNAGTRFNEGHWSIEFIGYFIYDLKIGSIYTIAELCGEEEE